MRAVREPILTKIIVSFVTAWVGFSSGAQAEWLDRGSLQRTFSRPLIVGASVSSGLFSSGPGTRATEMVMGANTAVNLAQNGAQGRHLTNINGASLANYSLVIGVDFMFWDSTQDDIAASRAALSRLIRSARLAHRPLVLGDIPALIGDQKERSRQALNHQIHSECRRSRECYVLSVEKLHRIAVTRGLVIGGHLYRYSDLSPDGLHLGQVGSDYVASVIIQTIARGR